MGIPKTTVTPVLSSKVGYLEDVRDQIATIVRFIIMNPGWISSIWETNLISFRKMSSEYEGDRDELSRQLGSAVKKTLSNMFQDCNFDTDFKASDYDENVKDGRYAIAFNILIYPQASQATGQAEPGLVAGSINVDPNTNDIYVTYEGDLSSVLL